MSSWLLAASLLFFSPSVSVYNGFGLRNKLRDGPLHNKKAGSCFFSPFCLSNLLFGPFRGFPTHPRTSLRPGPKLDDIQLPGESKYTGSLKEGGSRVPNPNQLTSNVDWHKTNSNCMLATKMVFPTTITSKNSGSQKSKPNKNCLSQKSMCFGVFITPYPCAYPWENGLARDLLTDSYPALREPKEPIPNIKRGNKEVKELVIRGLYCP